MFLDEGKAGRSHFPTRARVVADVTGAGDMVLAILGISAAAGNSAESGVQLANVAAGLVVRQFGVVAVSREELLDEIRNQGNPAAGKTTRDEPMAINRSEAKAASWARSISASGMAWPKEMVAVLTWPPQSVQTGRAPVA